MTNKQGRPKGPKKTLFRKRLTDAELQAVQAVLAGSPQPVPILNTCESAKVEEKCLMQETSLQNDFTTLREQLRLQTQRADDLQMELEEEQQNNSKLTLQIEQLMQTGGTERQSAYIAQLLDKIEKLGGKKGEFDQT